MFKCIESQTIVGWLTSRHMICHFFGGRLANEPKRGGASYEI